MPSNFDICDLYLLSWLSEFYNENDIQCRSALRNASITSNQYSGLVERGPKAKPTSPETSSLVSRVRPNAVFVLFLMSVYSCTFWHDSARYFWLAPQTCANCAAQHYRTSKLRSRYL